MGGEGMHEERGTSTWDTVRQSKHGMCGGLHTSSLSARGGGTLIWRAKNVQPGTLH